MPDKRESILRQILLWWMVSTLTGWFACASEIRAEAFADPLICDRLSRLAAELETGISRQEALPKLTLAETQVLALPGEDQVGCLKWLADIHRDLGSYYAETLYMEALVRAPDNPELLESIARYYRNYRGSKGLFAEAERYYLRAEKALEAMSSRTAEPTPWVLELRERIIRGRIELYKREGLGLVIPDHPEGLFGVFLGYSLDDGSFAIAHNDLATPALTLLHLDPDFDLHNILREQEINRRCSRLRFRYGSRPYLDIAWHTLDATNTITSQSLPVSFADLTVEEFRVAIEDTMNLAPVTDFLWRAEFRNGIFDVEGPGKETFDNFSASAIFTRNFGRIKTDFELLSSFSSIDLESGGTDRDRLTAVNLRFLHFRPSKASKSRLIDPRASEYTAGYVTRNRQFGEEVELVQETYFVGVKLVEAVTRTDLQILANSFSNTVRGRANEDSSNLELNVILAHRILDFVNNLNIRQADRPLGLSQWSISARYFLDKSLNSFQSFESQGIVVSSFVEIFSGPVHCSTVILEGSYEVRDYPNLDERQKRARFGLRLSF